MLQSRTVSVMYYTYVWGVTTLGGGAEVASSNFSVAQFSYKFSDSR